jgi:hypothetical protein
MRAALMAKSSFVPTELNVRLPVMAQGSAHPPAPENMPKLGLLRLSVYVADLLLIGDGDIEAVREPKVRTAWHTFLFSFGIYCLLLVLGVRIVEAMASPAWAFLWRIFSCLLNLWLLGSLATVANYHYRYLMLTEKDLRFRNIAFFFWASVLLYGLLYRNLYVLAPSFFSYPTPVVVPSPNLVALPPWTSLRLSFDFLLYSACTAVSIGYPRIASTSALVSFLNVTQALGSLLIVALLVATFVQKAKK